MTNKYYDNSFGDWARELDIQEQRAKKWHTAKELISFNQDYIKAIDKLRDNNKDAQVSSNTLFWISPNNLFFVQINESFWIWNERNEVWEQCKDPRGIVYTYPWS